MTQVGEERAADRFSRETLDNMHFVQVSVSTTSHHMLRSHQIGSSYDAAVAGVKRGTGGESCAESREGESSLNVRLSDGVPIVATKSQETAPVFDAWFDVSRSSTCWCWPCAWR